MVHAIADLPLVSPAWPRRFCKNAAKALEAAERVRAAVEALALPHAATPLTRIFEFPSDGLKTTQERIDHYGINAKNIKFINIINMINMMSFINIDSLIDNTNR